MDSTPFPPKPALEELRLRSSRLRDHSRDLLARSSQCRRRLRDAAAARPGGNPSATGARRDQVERLLRTEVDLENAIAECTAALGEVRRELGRHDGQADTSTIH